MKMSWACSGMLSSENDDLIFFKNCQKYKMHVHHVHHSSRGPVTVLSLQTSLSLTRNTNVTVAKGLYYILSTISLAISYVSHLFCAHLCSVSINFNCNDE